MAALPRSASRSGPAVARLPRLQILGYVLVVSALVFSAYCGLNAVRSSQAAALEAAAAAARNPRALLVNRGKANQDISTDSRNSQVNGIGSTVLQASPCPKCPTCEQQTQTVQTTNIMSTGMALSNPRMYHVVTTTAGFSNHWQARIHYYWFKKQRALCHMQPVCDMGGFTRLLHTGEADDLMDEIPTVVVKPLPKSAFGDGDTSYIVLNRPYAFMEWLKTASIPERYIVMCESDHLWLRPMPNMMPGEAQGAALFTYIVPTQYPDIVRTFIGNVSDDEIKKVPRIGNSPTFISVKDFKKLAPLWYNTTMAIFKDDAAHKAWNWVLEMYGYALATYRAGLHVGLKEWENMLAHPPWDKREVDAHGQPFYLLHLTYPLRYNSTGGITENETEVVWKFDKRTYGDQPPPRNLDEPPPVVDNDLARLIVAMINEATDAIPCWDTYHATKTVVTSCPPSTSAQSPGSIASGANQA